MHPYQKTWLRLSAFGDGPRGEFLSTLAGLVDTGVPLYEALQTMERVFRREGDGRAGILLDAMRRLHDGAPAADALRPWVAAHEAQMLAATARGVDLGSALRNAAALTESRKRIVGAVAGSMAYPAVLLAVGAGMMAVFSTQVIPTLSTLIPAEQWSGLALIYHAAAEALRRFGLAILAAALAAAALALWSLPRWRPGRVRGWLDRRVPPWNLYQVYQGAILLITASTMMRSGIAMGDTVAILRENNPAPWFRAHVAAIQGRLERGEGVRLAALDSPIFPADVRIAVALYDRLGEPDKALAALGEQAAASAEKSARKIGSACNAAVLLLVGALVGGVIPAIMGVTMDFYTKVTTTMRL